jgi:hypothetical protein
MMTVSTYLSRTGLACGAAAMLVTSSVHAFIAEEPEDGIPADVDILRHAKAVVVGSFTTDSTTILETHDVLDAEHGDYKVDIVVTKAKFKIDEVIDGKVDGDMIEVNVLGGTVGDRTERLMVDAVGMSKKVILPLDPNYGPKRTGYVVRFNRTFTVNSSEVLEFMRSYVLMLREHVKHSFIRDAEQRPAE